MAECLDHPRILIVDDDEIVIHAIESSIREEGYDIVATNSAQEAVRLLESGPFAAILSDQRMPEMDGLDLLAQAQRRQPHCSRILVTGAPTLKTVIEAVNRGEIFRFVAKPWALEELLATVRNAVQRYELLELNDQLQRDTQQLNEQLGQANAALEEKVSQLSRQQTELEKAKHALEANLGKSLELCYRILDAYHPLLGRETKDSVQLCHRLTAEEHLPKATRETLAVSAWIQNVGLIGVPREVILKSRQNPHTLTSSESRMIHDHPVYGEFLAGFAGALQEVAATVRAHHERWDGTGYPDGLAGEAIPLPARYLAVVAYFIESGLPREMALDEILQLSGTAFDPEAVRVFLRVVRSHGLPRKVREITFSELQNGMVMARGLHTPGGMLLVAEGQLLDEHFVHRLQQHNRVDPTAERLLVYE